MFNSESYIKGILFVFCRIQTEEAEAIDLDAENRAADKKKKALNVKMCVCLQKMKDNTKVPIHSRREFHWLHSADRPWSCIEVFGFHHSLKVNSRAGTIQCSFDSIRFRFKLLWLFFFWFDSIKHASALIFLIINK